MEEKKVTEKNGLQDAEIAKLKVRMDHVEKTVQPISEAIPEITVNVENLTKATNDLRTATSGLLRFQQEHEGETKGKEAAGRVWKWVVGMALSVLLAMAGLIVTLIVKLT